MDVRKANSADASLARHAALLLLVGVGDGDSEEEVYVSVGSAVESHKESAPPCIHAVKPSWCRNDHWFDGSLENEDVVGWCVRIEKCIRRNSNHKPRFEFLNFPRTDWPAG